MKYALFARHPIGLTTEVKVDRLPPCLSFNRLQQKLDTVSVASCLLEDWPWREYSDSEHSFNSSATSLAVSRSEGKGRFTKESWHWGLALYKTKIALIFSLASLHYFLFDIFLKTNVYFVFILTASSNILTTGHKSTTLLHSRIDIQLTPQISTSSALWLQL